MGLLDPTPPRRTSSSAATPRSDLTGIQLLEAATTAHAHAEQEFDRSPETREDLEHAYLAAAHALGAESHPDRAVAWLGVATVRRYQKGRRADTLTAFEALTADPDRIPVWDAYFDYITYAVSAAALLAIVERMPAPIRARNLSAVMAVAHGTDRWGTMSPDDQQQFRTALPGLLDALDDRPSLGALLSADAMHEYRHGSHPEAHRLMRGAIATGHPTPACVDRLTIDLVKLGEKAEAASILRDALTRPVPSDSTRNRMAKRLARCTTAAPQEPANVDEPGIDTPLPRPHRGSCDRARTPRSPAEPGGPRSAGGLPAPLTEGTFRLDDLAALEPSVQTAVIIENETTCLTVPLPEDGVVIWGKGFEVDRVGALPWLHDALVHYWGDLDTHGFAILDKLRLVATCTIVSHGPGDAARPHRPPIQRIGRPDCARVEAEHTRRCRLRTRRMVGDQRRGRAVQDPVSARWHADLVGRRRNVRRRPWRGHHRGCGEVVHRGGGRR